MNKKVVKPIRESLGLKQPPLLYPAHGPNDAIAGAHVNARVSINGPGAGLKFANKAVAQALKPLLLSLAQV
nr:hypothetical protein NCPCFENI_01231 [Cupriavidus sp.]